MNLGRYAVQRVLGEGACGKVFLARDPAIGRDVAIKVVTAEGLSRDRFQRETRLLGQLDHEHILKVYDAGEHEGTPFLVMEYVAGDTLRAHTDAPLDEWVATLARVADACSAAHAIGVVHRDLKPENVLMGERGPVVADFGVAKLLEASDTPSITRTGVMVGTPHYMAPEQVAGEADEIGPWTDVYALGAMLYERLTGRVPFSGTGMLEVAVKIAGEPPPPPRDFDTSVPRTLEAIALRCLAKAPSARYADMDTLARALRGWRVEAAEPESAKWVWLAVAAPLVLVAAAGLALLTRTPRRVAGTTSPSPPTTTQAGIPTPPERPPPRPAVSAAAATPVVSRTSSPTSLPTSLTTPAPVASPRPSPGVDVRRLTKNLHQWASGKPDASDRGKGWAEARSGAELLAAELPRLSGKARRKALVTLGEVWLSLRDYVRAARRFEEAKHPDGRAALVLVRFIRFARRGNAEAVHGSDSLLDPQRRAWAASVEQIDPAELADRGWAEMIRAMRKPELLVSKLPIAPGSVGNRVLNLYVGMMHLFRGEPDQAEKHFLRATQVRALAALAREELVIVARLRSMKRGPVRTVERMTDAAHAAPLDVEGLRQISSAARSLSVRAMIHRWRPYAAVRAPLERLEAAVRPLRETPAGATAWADVQVLRWRLVLREIGNFGRVQGAFARSTKLDNTAWQSHQGKAVALALRLQVIRRFPHLAMQGETPVARGGALSAVFREAVRRGGRSGALERKVLRDLFPRFLR